MIIILSQILFAYLNNQWHMIFIIPGTISKNLQNEYMTRSHSLHSKYCGESLIVSNIRDQQQSSSGKLNLRIRMTRNACSASLKSNKCSEIRTVSYANYAPKIHGHPRPEKPYLCFQFSLMIIWYAFVKVHHQNPFL